MYVKLTRYDNRTRLEDIIERQLANAAYGALGIKIAGDFHHYNSRLKKIRVCLLN